jgi:hypothetical protein
VLHSFLLSVSTSISNVELGNAFFCNVVDRSSRSMTDDRRFSMFDVNSRVARPVGDGEYIINTALISRRNRRHERSQCESQLRRHYGVR